MHNPGGLMNVPPPRATPLPPPPAYQQVPGRVPAPTGDYISLNGHSVDSNPSQNSQHAPRGHNRTKASNGLPATHQHLYNRTKRKRDSSNGSRNACGNDGAAGAPDASAHPVAAAVNGANQGNNEPQPDDNNSLPLTPWNPRGYMYSEGIIGLHEEIEDFVQWMVPTVNEHDLRLAVINRLRAAIREIYPAAVVHIFGSFKTGLYLPTSDIDLVLVGHWEKIPFEIVRAGIEARNLARKNSIQVLEHATVPIIKLVDRITGIRVDISFNMTNGLRSVELIKHFKRKFPAMAKLIYVIKQFLLQRDLNEVYTGGLSSYALILMVVSFLQLHPRGERAGSEKANLGVLLIEFFELYGRHFNYSSTAIRISDGGSYVSKEEMRHYLAMGTGIGSLCIQDPYLPENDVGKSSYGIPVVKVAFEHAYIALTRILASGGRQLQKGESLLSHIVRVSDDVLRFRRWAASDSSLPFVVDASQPAEEEDTPATSAQNVVSSEDQSLSEDPLLPTHTPTPSRDVTPRELPQQTFTSQPPPLPSKKPDALPTANEKNSGKETAADVVVVVNGKDADTMSGVSTTTTSSSSMSRTETDSDDLIGRPEDQSGSPSSVMSISPASSEVGSVRSDRGLHRNSNAGNGNNRRGDSNKDNLNGYSKHSNRNDRRYWNNTGSGPNHRKPVGAGGNGARGGHERSDLVLNWRNECPDKNRDWPNAGSTSASVGAVQHPEGTHVNAKSKSNMNENGDRNNSSSKANSSGDEKKSTSSPVAVAQATAAMTDLTNGNLVTSKDSTCNDSKSTALAPDTAEETGFIKSRTFNNSKKRKKQRRNRVSQNIILTPSDGVMASNNRVTEKGDNERKVVQPPPSSSSSTVNAQNRFSTKPGQSKPNR